MKSKYLLGLQEIDVQHEKIFELAQQAQDPNLEAIDMQKIVVDLVNYAKFHLDQEEALLQSQGQQKFLETHVKLHDAFREQTMDMYYQFRLAETDDDRRALLQKVAKFCETWLQNHIDIEDRKYVPLLKKQPLGNR